MSVDGVSLVWVQRTKLRKNSSSESQGEPT